MNFSDTNLIGIDRLDLLFRLLCILHTMKNIKIVAKKNECEPTKFIVGNEKS